MESNYKDLEWEMMVDGAFDRVCIMASEEWKEITDENLLKEVCEIKCDSWCDYDKEWDTYSITDKDFEEMCVEIYNQYEKELALVG